MNYRIKLSIEFAKQLKRLAKRYRSLKQDIAELGDELQKNPYQGVDLGNGLRKVRMSIASKGKGKSGGARVITFTAIISEYDAEILLLTIYDKSEKENITDAELRELRLKCGV